MRYHILAHVKRRLLFRGIDQVRQKMDLCEGNIR